MDNELLALGAAFVAAALVASVGRRIGLPTIPLFILAGIALGPNTPGVVLFEHPEDLELLAALGLVLLLFSVGLEFSPSTLVERRGRVALAGGLYVLVNVGTGLVFGAALGWGGPEALVIAGALGISSSAIVTKLVVELRRLTNPETPLILGIIVVDDLFLALYLALLHPVLGETEGVGGALLSIGRAFAFLLALALAARFGPGLVGRLIPSADDELLTVAFVGVAVLVAGLAEEVGVSDAIGALGAGIILARTVSAPRIHRLVLPLRDLFAALFLFAFGLTIDPGDVGSVAVPIAVAVVLSLACNVTAGVLVSRMEGLDREAASNVSFTVLARGEFALILAALAAAAGLDDRVGPFVAGYVLVLAVGSPLLAARSARLGRLLPATLFDPGGRR